MTDPRRARPDAPVERFLRAHGVRRIDLASRSGVGLDTLKRLDRGEVAGIKLGTLCRVAVALGVAPIDLVPELAARPRGGGLIAEAALAAEARKRRLAGLRGEATRRARLQAKSGDYR